MTLFFFSTSETCLITIQSVHTCGVGNTPQERKNKRLFFSLVSIYYSIIIRKGLCMSGLEAQKIFKIYSNLSPLLLWSAWTHIPYHIATCNTGHLHF